MQQWLAVETDRLTKQYGAAAVVNNLTLSIAQGEVVGLLGPNGAGKSTVIRMLVGAVRPTSGTIRVLGQNLGDPKLRGRIGYLPETSPLSDLLTVKETLDMHATLAGVKRRDSRVRIAELLNRVDVTGDSRISNLSRGMKQRVGIALALVNDPDLVVLDEPTAALDPAGRELVMKMVHELRQAGKTVLISSHLLSEIETMMCERVLILNQGRTVAEGAVADLLTTAPKVVIEVTQMSEKALQALRGIAIRLEFDPEIPNRLIAHLESQSSTPAIAAALVENGVGLISLEPVQETLEDLFARVTINRAVGAKR